MRFPTFCTRSLLVVALQSKLTYPNLLTLWIGPSSSKCWNLFSFNDTFYNWINLALHFAKFSINVNGRLEGFLSHTKGVRQGDPLSPFLFYLAEDILSRRLTNLVNENQLKPMIGPSNFSMPTHCMYEDDIMLFCKGTYSNMQALSSLFIDMP